MNANNGKDAAFPRKLTESIGLTKREYFAALAMLGIMSSPDTGYYENDVVSKNAVALADALLEALEAQ